MNEEEESEALAPFLRSLFRSPSTTIIMKILLFRLVFVVLVIRGHSVFGISHQHGHRLSARAEYKTNPPSAGNRAIAGEAKATTDQDEMEFLLKNPLPSLTHIVDMSDESVARNRQIAKEARQNNDKLESNTNFDIVPGVEHKHFEKQQISPTSGQNRLLDRSIKNKRSAISSALLHLTTSSSSNRSVLCGDDNEVSLRIEIHTDNYPQETSAAVKVWLSSDLFAMIPLGPYENSGTLHVETFCVDSTRCYQFEIYDSQGDGICCGYGYGWYKITYDGILVAEGGTFDSSDVSSLFGNGCSTTSSPTITSMPTISSSPTTVPSRKPSTSPSIFPSISPTTKPTASFIPTASNIPSETPTTSAASDLIAIDENNRRYFPERPIRPAGSYGYQTVPNCTAPSSDDRVGCVGMIRTVKRRPPSWVGSILYKPPKCVNLKCEFAIPMTNNALPLSTKLIPTVENRLRVIDLPGEANVRSIAAVDINSDDKIDIILGSSENHKSQFLLNQGDGSFSDPYDLPGSNDAETRSIAVADIDGDGKFDIILGNYNKKNQFLLNQGDGSFSGPYDLPGEDDTKTTSIAVADIDGDGTVDTIVGNDGEKNYVLFNKGEGLFNSIPYVLPGEGMKTESISIADIDGDGTVDIVVGNYEEKNYVLFNEGEGLFNSVPYVLPGEGMKTESISVADIDGDGTVDIVVGNYEEKNEVLLNEGTGIFKHTIHLPGRYAWTVFISIADINGDGRVDIIVGNYFETNQIFLNQGKGSFSAPFDLPGGAINSFAIVAADINGEGNKVDIIVGGDHGNSKILMNDRGVDGSFSTFIDLGGAENMAIRSSAVADVNGDGKMDIIVGNWQRKNQILFNKGDGSFSAPVYLPGEATSTYSIAVADFNGDGKADIVVGNRDEENHILMNVGNGLFGAPIALGRTFPYTESLAAADVNGDGKLDIIVGTHFGYNQLFLNQDDGTFSEPNDLPGGAVYTSSIAAADIDGDGKIDIVVGNWGAMDQVLLNKGSGIFDASMYLQQETLDTVSIAVADINSDGRVDIVVGTRICEKNHILFNTNQEFFADAPVELPRGGEFPTKTIAVADIDGDGRVDIIAVNDSDMSQIWLQQMDGTFSDPIENLGSLVDSSTVWVMDTVSIADVDDDGTVDIIFGGSRLMLSHYIHCPNGGAQLHATSWCFECPSFMDISSHLGVQKTSTCRECLPDHVQPEGTKEGCRQCFLGERNLGNDVCASCPDGTYYNNRIERVESNSSTWHEKRCVECPKGHYSQFNELPAINECFKCVSGTYQPNRGSSSCMSCEKGQYQTRQGQSSCQSCAKGGFCNSSSTIGGGYQSCPTGTYNDQMGMSALTNCTECPAGTYSMETGADASTSCLPCQLGTFNNETGQNKCQSCSKGTFQNNTKQLHCVECAPGSYADKPGLSGCIKCPYRLDSTKGSEICPFCAPGFYLNNSISTGEAIFMDPSANCFECPAFRDTTCPSKNTTLQTMKVPFGYWRASLYTSEIYKCSNNACIGSKEALSQQKYSQNISQEKIDENDYCLQGHTGPLCEVCLEQNSYFSRISGRCQQCPTAFRLFLQAGLIILILLICFLCAIVTPSAWQSSISTLLSNLSFQAKVKILVSFYQVVSSLQSVYGVNISPQLIQWVHLFQYFSLDIFDLIGLPKACIGSMKQQLIIGAIWPFMLVVLGMCVVSLHILHKVRRLQSSSTYSQVDRIQTSTDETIRSVAGNGIYQAVKLVVVVLYFTIPTVSRGIFDAIKCKSFKTKDYGDPPFFKSFLLVDMEIECNIKNDGTYRSIQGIFWFFFVLWPILIPFGFLALLINVRQAIFSGSIAPLANACRFLWSDYDESVWFWDVVDLWRKIILSGFIMFIDTEEGSNKILRLGIASTISMLYLGILAIAHPYKQINDLYFAFISNFLLACCFSAGVILRLCNEDEDKDASDSCSRFVGQTFNSFRASVVVVASIAGMLIIGFGFLIVLAANSILAPTVLLTSGKSPILELSEDCNFHAFMSHVWATGKARTHAITHKLQLHCPRLKIWLDVNHLEDVTKLEEHVAEAEIFILFYSHGYFRSRNCRREIYTAIRLKKPVIILYVGNYSSSIVDAFRTECTEHCVDSDSPGSAALLQHVFGDESDAPPILWLDQGAFSAATLKLIYFRIFSHLPYYQQHPLELNNSANIVVPGESAGGYSLKNDVNVLVCKDNPGAEELAKELNEALVPEKASHLMEIIDAEDFFKEQLDIENAGGVEISAITSNNDIPSCSATTVLLLYLNRHFFLEDSERVLQRIVQFSTRDPNIRVVLVHEQDILKGGCEFDLFFRQVPQDVIDPPYEIFKDMAIPLYSTEEYRIVSFRQIIHQFGITDSTRS